MKKQSGFTLVELIVVIVILGILSAVAIPKFISLESEARKASLQGLKGGLASANSLVHALALIEGKTAATGESVTVEGSTVALAYGYPTVAGIKASMSDVSDYTEAAGVYTIQNYSGTNCQVAFVAATAVTAPPTITVTDSGC